MRASLRWFMPGKLPQTAHKPKNSRYSRGGRNRVGKREKWPKQSWEEGEIGGKSREEGEKERLTFREEGEIGSKSREGEKLAQKVGRREIYPLFLPPLAKCRQVRAKPKGRFTRCDFVAYDKLTTRLRHELLRVNQTYNSLRPSP